MDGQIFAMRKKNYVFTGKVEENRQKIQKQHEKARIIK